MSKGHMAAIEALKLLRTADLSTFRELKKPVTLRRGTSTTPSKVKKVRLQPRPPASKNLPHEQTETQRQAEATKAARIWTERMGNERYDNRPGRITSNMEGWGGLAKDRAA